MGEESGRSGARSRAGRMRKESAGFGGKGKAGEWAAGGAAWGRDRWTDHFWLRDFAG